MPYILIPIVPLCFSDDYVSWSPIPVAAQSKAHVYGRSPAEIVGSNLTGGIDVFLL
jgi:hypothetical protein